MIQLFALHALLQFAAGGEPPPAPAAPPAAAPAPLPIFDGRRHLKPAKIDKADADLVRSKVLERAREAGKDAKENESCVENFEVRDVATGSFTRAGVVQRVFVYAYCEGPSNTLGRAGIAVFEGEELVAHIGYARERDHAIGALPDLDGDGLSEIILAFGGVGMGEAFENVALLGWSPSGGLKRFGLLSAYSDDCGNPEPSGKKAYRIFAQTGKAPDFSRETFTAACDSKAWRKAEAQIPVLAQEDEGVAYEILE